MAITIQRQTAEKLVEAFNRMDVDTIISLRSPDCLRVIKPTSLGHKPTTNDQYKASLQQLKPIFQNFRLSVHGITEDKDARTIVMYLHARADTLAGEYVNEYMWTMEFDESGQRITKWTEFVDAVVNKEFYPKLAAAMKAYQSRNQV